MQRIVPIEARQAGLFTRFIYWMTKRKIGHVALPVKVTAHQTRLLWGMGEMEMAQDAMRSVTLRLKALASIKVGMLVGCPF